MCRKYCSVFLETVEAYFSVLTLKPDETSKSLRSTKDRWIENNIRYEYIYNIKVLKLTWIDLMQGITKYRPRSKPTITSQE